MARQAKYPGYRTMTGAERRNARMHEIFEEARRLGAFEPANLQAAADGIARLKAERAIEKEAAV